MWKFLTYLITVSININVSHWSAMFMTFFAMRVFLEAIMSKSIVNSKVRVWAFFNYSEHRWKRGTALVGACNIDQ